MQPRKYVAGQQAAELSNGTINRDLGTLSRMLRLAYEHGKLLRLPVIRKLKESAPRQGFFEREQFEAVRRHLPEDLQVAVSVAYTLGWRMQSEVLALERRQLDLEAGTLRLDAGSTKNDQGRVVSLTPELRSLLASQIERVRAVERELSTDSVKCYLPYLFPHLRGAKRRKDGTAGKRGVGAVLGERQHDFRKRWATASKAAGIAGRLRHDFRRTAVRNMVNAGIPERVAMTISGHRTRSVFDRYHIVSPADLAEAARKLTGTISGTVTTPEKKSRRVKV